MYTQTHMVLSYLLLHTLTSWHVQAIAEAQAGKSYLHYLIALCQYYAGLLSESQLSFDKAVGEVCDDVTP